MSPAYKSDYISYRIDKAAESIKAAELMAENQLLTSAVNRCYYACFYMVDALLYGNQLSVKSHAGAKNQFNLNFIKTGKIPVEFGELFNELFDLRQEGDYGSKFEIEPPDIQTLIADTKRFIECLSALLK
ncbi:MAG: HEPN domain-containing protein [Bacteroidota bacterium]